jgi:hypothetical protein
MRAVYFYTAALLLFGFLPQGSFCQASYPNTFYNNGDVVYVQSGAILHVQGDLVNAGSGSAFTNNGVLNVEGDFSNAGKFNYDRLIGEGTVRFIGSKTVAGAVSGSATSGVQTISGNMSVSGSAYFYNMVIDREAPGQVVALATNVLVAGSLVWNDVNATTSAATYHPSSYPSTIGSATAMQVRGQTRTGNGLIQMYSGGNDYGLYLSNASTDAIAGYQALGTYAYSGTSGGSAAKATNDQYAQSRGSDGATTGLSELINGTGTYVFPVGSPNLYYNPVELNFSSGQADMQLTCKFTENSSLTSGGTVFANFVDTTHSASSSVANAYVAANPDFTDNPGYNVYQTDCIGNSKWFIMNTFVENHGYWSMNAGTTGGVSTGAGTLNGAYTIQAFPHGYTDYAVSGSTSGPNKRIVKEDIDGFTATPSASNFNTQVQTDLNDPMSDYLTYSYLGTGRGSFVSCDDITGITGGAYTSFSHYGVATSSSPTGQALPITLIALTAEPAGNSYIRVSWATASEQNNSGFEVERSADGVNFSALGWVAGNGTTSEQHSYEFDDKNASPNTTYYYRLNQLDVDGHGTLTYIVSAMITGGPGISVSDFQPNPTNGSTRLVISTSSAEPLSVKFYDVLGKLIMSSDDNQVAYGTNTLDFNINQLADATYTAIIRIGSNVYSKKVVLLSNR